MRNKTKILHITNTFYPAWAYGGIARVTYEQCLQLVDRGHDVTVFTTDVHDRNGRAEYYDNPANIDGIKVYRFRNISNLLAWKRIHTPLSSISALKKTVKGFDIVHIHGFESILHVSSHYYAKKHGVPYILQAHGSLAIPFQKRIHRRIYNKVWGDRILKDAANVIALTRTESETLKLIGINEDKIKVMPNGIDLSEFRNLPKKGEFRGEYGLSHDQKIILYLGRIHKIKGLDLLVNAFAMISWRIVNAKLVIIGPDDGGLLPLKKMVRELKIEDKTLFLGPLYGRDKLEAYVDADVYVLPSVYETFPMTILEACACGTPVIATDSCGIADIIDGKVGIVVPRDTNSLSKAIKTIVNDDKKKQEFCQGGKSLVCDIFNWNRVIYQLEKIYSDCKEST